MYCGIEDVAVRVKERGRRGWFEFKKGLAVVSLVRIPRCVEDTESAVPKPENLPHLDRGVHVWTAWWPPTSSVHRLHFLSHHFIELSPIAQL